MRDIETAVPTTNWRHLQVVDQTFRQLREISIEQHQHLHHPTRISYNYIVRALTSDQRSTLQPMVFKIDIDTSTITYNITRAISISTDFVN